MAAITTVDVEPGRLEKSGFLGMNSTKNRLFFSKEGVVGQDQFAANLNPLRKLLMPASLVCNLQQDRYLFSLGIVATLLNNQTTVLPPSLAPQAIVASMSGARDPVIFAAAPDNDNIARRISFDGTEMTSVGHEDFRSSLKDARAEIRVFSSGTTKHPECNVKTWSMLRGGAAITDQILQGLDVEPDSLALIGTTPHGHMFGLEATVFAALGFGHCVYRDTVFYPADLEAATKVARELGFSKLVLVTSPAHLRFLESTILATPEICCVLSATAPLSRAQAERIEARGGVKVMEIYGSTETGSLAFRRTTQDETWTPAAGFRLVSGTATGCTAGAPHLPEPVLLGDDVDLRPDGHFKLLGRTGDIVSIRGKRNRVSALNAILVEVSEISDGIFLHSKRESNDLLAIAAVPALDNALSETVIKVAIRKHLLRYVDPAFVPKKILIQKEIPRTPTGKVRNEKIDELAKQAGISG